eukprot:TRINITY_DN1567_c0_g1_i4.p1 TRINITY_DN1567_c0_g1~~TRINITY_DN1567_c0_g1_i4.p1  ORF type:complete len:1846 (+),score=295.54 TRINITY_DN1567_c0_g1_i4:215-5752(+)
MMTGTGTATGSASQTQVAPLTATGSASGTLASSSTTTPSAQPTRSSSASWTGSASPAATATGTLSTTPGVTVSRTPTTVVSSSATVSHTPSTTASVSTSPTATVSPSISDTASSTQRIDAEILLSPSRPALAIGESARLSLLLRGAACPAFSAGLIVAAEWHFVPSLGVPTTLTGVAVDIPANAIRPPGHRVTVSASFANGTHVAVLPFFVPVAAPRAAAVDVGPAIAAGATPAWLVSPDDTAAVVHVEAMDGAVIRADSRLRVSTAGWLDAAEYRVAIAALLPIPYKGTPGAFPAQAEIPAEDAGWNVSPSVVVPVAGVLAGTAEARVWARSAAGVVVGPVTSSFSVAAPIPGWLDIAETAARTESLVSPATCVSLAAAVAAAGAGRLPVAALVPALLVNMSAGMVGCGAADVAAASAALLASAGVSADTATSMLAAVTVALDTACVTPPERLEWDSIGDRRALLLSPPSLTAAESALMAANALAASAADTLAWAPLPLEGLARALGVWVVRASRLGTATAFKGGVVAYDTASRLRNLLGSAVSSGGDGDMIALGSGGAGMNPHPPLEEVAAVAAAFDAPVCDIVAFGLSSVVSGAGQVAAVAAAGFALPPASGARASVPLALPGTAFSAPSMAGSGRLLCASRAAVGNESGAFGVIRMATDDTAWAFGAAASPCAPLHTPMDGVTYAHANATELPCAPVECIAATTPATVAWLRAPVVASVSGCHDVYPRTLHCSVGASVRLHLTGRSLATVTEVTVGTSSCAITDRSDTLLTCNVVLPPPESAEVLGADVAVTAELTAVNYTAYVAAGALVLREAPMTLSGIDGCPVAMHGLHTAGCAPAGAAAADVLRLVGTGFAATPSHLTVAVGGRPCQDVAVVDDGVLVAARCDGTGEDVPVVVRRGSTTASGAFVSFQTRPVVTNVSGCPVEGCATDGSAKVSVHGDGFLSGPAWVTPDVLVAGVPCMNVTAVSASELQCTGVTPPIGMTTAGARVVVRGVRSDETATLHFRSQCRRGTRPICDDHGTCVEALGTCTCWASPCLGYWGGIDAVSCDRCRGGYWGPSCTHPCPGGPEQPCSGHGVCSPTDGVCACAAGWAGSTCEVACPATSGGSCGGHGTCQDPGVCVCSGTWALSDAGVCTACAIGYAGTSCALPCPGLPGAPCSGHGTCSPDTAVCSCDADFVGTACEMPCPALSEEVPCSGHGSCTALPEGVAGCICMDSASTGHWDGARCDRCAAGWSGAECGVRCPVGTGGLVCSGRGVCDAATESCVCQSAGVCGRACEETDEAVCHLLTCPIPGTYGPACAGTCPQTATGVCNGAGACSDGRNGTGRCSCIPSYGGAGCASFCPNGCSGHGACDAEHGVCLCDGTFGQADCSAQCPGSPACSGHGFCADGAAGSGACECLSGWRGEDCSVECAGGADIPCSGHGVCDADGLCDCDTHFAPSNCSTCAAGFLGIYCDARCPTTPSGAVCGGHGRCVGNTPHCVCDAEDVLGFWTGALCTECQSGYHGSTCTTSCPGGACAPCSGHGTCDDGINGTGLCTCSADVSVGYWWGDACHECRAGYFGPWCMRACPGGATSPCHGHGTCSDGPDGTGVCTCNADASRGHWDGTECSACASGHWGPGCKHECVGGAALPCSGRGACSDGVNGTGECVRCDPGYGGADCSQTCPRSGGELCGGIARGMCSGNVSFSPVCACEDAFQGVACEACVAGYAGPLCEPCPQNASGAVCSDRALCADTHPPSCNCDSAETGYGGTACDVPCPGTLVSAPCYGHGVCQASGACACYASVSVGHWAGGECRACAAGWSGTQCTTPCPADAAGQVCSGRGTCAAQGLGRRRALHHG